MSRRAAPILAGLCFLFALLVPGIASAATRPIPATPVTIAVYADVLRHFNPQLPGWQSRDLARHLLVNAARWKIDANILAAIVSVESNWHTHAISSAGAIGLGQLMPGTAATLGVNPRDPVENLAGAARYLRGLMQRFSSGPNRYQMVFAAYNAGPRAVLRYGGIPPYDETQHYVVKVLRAWHEVQSSVHIPRNAYPLLHVDGSEPHGDDVDYWLGDK
jgi:soluble lytic murein transglycosylase-like protein